jgi:hypothetical protein
MRKNQNPSLRRDREIWGENLGINISILRQNPSLLAIQDHKIVDAVKVIERFNHIPQDWGNVYGSLGDFLTRTTAEGGLGLISEKHQNPNFFPFAYDWRQDNQESAIRLAEFIQDKDKSRDSRFRFIVHSMGGIVTRLMLLNNPDIVKRTDLLFQIASPLSGSVKAYYTLKKRPQFNPIFDFLCQKLQNGDKVAQLRTAIMGFPSIYQLLPPPEIQCLFDRKGNLYSALEDSIWQGHFRNYVRTAREVHIQLRKSESLNTQIRVRCIGSAKYPTPKRYLIDRLQDSNLIDHEINLIMRIRDIMGLRRIPLSADGDDTVTFSSAIAYSVHKPENEIDSEPANHITICDNEQVHNLIKTEWNQG